jgi:F-type H+-transporting ATPase subunit b
MLLLTKVLFKPILQTIEKRKASIYGTRAEVETKEKQFKEQLDNYNTTIEAAKKRLTEELVQSRKEAEADQAALLETTRDEASNLSDEAREKIREEEEKARIILKAESQLFGSFIIRKLLGRDLSQKTLGLLLFSFLSASILVFIFPSALWAATEDPAHHNGAPAEQYIKLVWQIINFVVLVAVLFFLMRKNLADYFVQRSNQIGTEIDEAQKLRIEMERKIKEYEARLRGVDEEVARMKEEAQKEMAALRRRMQEETKRVSRMILTQTQRNIELETKRAQEALQTEASLLAINLAEDVLDQEVTPEDQARLLQEYINKMGESR